MDLKKLIDKTARYIFLAKNKISIACKIISIDESFIYFTNPESDPVNYDSGHFLSGDGQGIVLFEEPEIEKLQVPNEQLPAPLYRINFSKVNFSLSNRRRYYRYEFKKYLPISFVIFGEPLMAQALNISEGGLRMRLDSPIKRDILCNFEIKITDQNQTLNLKTDGLVVYSEPDPETKKHVVGIQFVQPEKLNPQEKSLYEKSIQSLSEYIKNKIAA